MKIAVKNLFALAALLFAAATLATAYTQTQPIASQMAQVAGAEKPADRKTIDLGTITITTVVPATARLCWCGLAASRSL
jgi:hypothetical protein